MTELDAQFSRQRYAVEGLKAGMSVDDIKRLYAWVMGAPTPDAAKQPPLSPDTIDAWWAIGSEIMGRAIQDGGGGYVVEMKAGKAPALWMSAKDARYMAISLLCAADNCDLKQSSR